MQIHGQDPVNTGLGQQIGDQLGRNRRARLCAAILTGIAEIGDDGGDHIGRGPLERVGHDQKLHQIVIGRIGGGLEDEHVFRAHILVDLDKYLTIVEPLNPRINQLDRLTSVKADPLGNRFGEGSVGVS